MTEWTDERGSLKWVITVEWVKRRSLEGHSRRIAATGRKQQVLDTETGERKSRRKIMAGWGGGVKVPERGKCLPAVVPEQSSCFKVTQERRVALDWSKENTLTNSEPLVVQERKADAFILKNLTSRVTWRSKMFNFYLFQGSRVVKTVGKRQRVECRDYAADVELFADRTEASRCTTTCKGKYIETYTHTQSTVGVVCSLCDVPSQTRLSTGHEKETDSDMMRWWEGACPGAGCRPIRVKAIQPPIEIYVWVSPACSILFQCRCPRNKIINHIYLNMIIKSFPFSMKKATIF